MSVELSAAAAGSAPALRLRPWRDEDIPALVEAYRDPVLRRYTRVPVRCHEDAVRWLELQHEGWVTGERLSFALWEDAVAEAAESVLGEGPYGSGGRLMGHVVLKRSAVTEGEVGYWTVAHARGRGVATRAVEALTAWAFATFAEDGLKRMKLLHQVDNVASCRVAEKAGYAYAQTLPARPPFPLDGHLHVRESARG